MTSTVSRLSVRPPSWRSSRGSDGRRPWPVLLAAALVAGCVQPGLTDLLARPAERALLAGLQAYDDGRYGEAEKSLRAALDAGLASGRDRAAAHKHLAFLYCTSDREQACAQAFVAARQADPAFALSRSEAGHPMWGPVYRRVVR